MTKAKACWLKCLFYTIYASKGGRLWRVCTFAWSCLGLRHKWRLNTILCLQRRLWGVCTFAQARLSLRNSTKISCAGSDGDLCTIYVNSECCGEFAPATTAHLCNHQCVVSMRQKMLPVRCNKNPQ